MIALYVLTAALVVAVLVAGDGVFVHYLTVRPWATVVVLGVPTAAWLLGSQPALVLLHVTGAFLFVGAHTVSAFVALRVPSERDGARARALLELSSWAVDWMHIGLALLVGSGIAAGFVGRWWSQPWLWLAIDLLLAVVAYMYAANTYSGALRGLTDGGPEAWTAEVRAAVDQRKALTFLGVGTLALAAITALMVLKPG